MLGAEWSQSEAGIAKVRAEVAAPLASVETGFYSSSCHIVSNLCDPRGVTKHGPWFSHPYNGDNIQCISNGLICKYRNQVSLNETRREGIGNHDIPEVGEMGRKLQ